MRLFDWLVSNPEDEAHKQEREARREESRRSIEAGGLPIEATQRLSTQAARQGTPQHLWTSDLSVSEFLLARRAGFEPLGQVMGSSVYHVGWQWRTQNWRNSYWQGGGAAYELDVLTQAFYNARHLALNRLAQEAAILGATGIIGVRLKKTQQDWGAGLLEFSAIGTAIREEGLTHAQSTAKPSLFLSELSGEEFWKLREAGFRPAGIAVGNCTYYQIPTWSTQNTTRGGIFNSGSWQNVELPDYTQALYEARELAMTRMENEAQSVAATGIVSVDLDIDMESHEVEVNKQTRLDMIYHFTAIGTAIKPFPYSQPKLTVSTAVPLKLRYR